MTEQLFDYVPLQQWIQNEGNRIGECTSAGIDPQTLSLLKKQFLLRKTTVAYGIAKLLEHVQQVEFQQQQQSGTIANNIGHFSAAAQERQQQCTVISNFSVVTPHKNCKVGGSTETTDWKDEVCGIYMRSPTDTYAEISEPSFLANIEDDKWGRYLEVEITPPLTNNNHHTTSYNNNMNTRKRPGESSSNECHLFGILLYELYSGVSPNNNSTDGSSPGGVGGVEPARKKSIVRYDKRKGKSYSTLQQTPNTPLQELGYPPSISMLVQNLIDGHECYTTLEEVSSDIHLLLSDPECFLFEPTKEQFAAAAHGNGNVQLHIKEGKLYGREKEMSLITDTFCRVSEGNNEAFFIGGYSGSGKSMLVHCLTSRIDIAGGYVLEQKVDQMSMEPPLLDVISAFNELCLLIKDKSSAPELNEISSKLMHEFESDVAVLVRLLPNIDAIFPGAGGSPRHHQGSPSLMLNLQNVCFVLQRFMGIVSSKLHPVMLFLDDIHWAGSTSLELIQSLLRDTRGGCFMFVGSYRDNEVTANHPIFDLMKNIRSSGVGSTAVQLRGLGKQDLNQMIAEMLCILPRLCSPLSDILTDKTEGNPYFLLEFLRSLVDRRLLKYSLREKRWIWDESKIRSEHITENVLYLLSSKMTSLSENIQLVLKIVSCFGIMIDEQVIDYLGKTPQYNGIENWINQVIKEGFIRKIDTKFRFVHDKVREAAYSLIPQSSKKQFHFDLGMLLHTATVGQDLHDTIFQVVNQINHGVPELIQEQQLHKKVEISDLNFHAGSKAMDLSDHETANSYLCTALSLLPANHWSIHYEMSLKMYFVAANAAYTSGDSKRALDLLKSILENGRCTEDKLDAFYLYCMMLHACEKSDVGYNTCVNVLKQLGETLPATLAIAQLQGMMKETGMLLGRMSDADIQQLKPLDNSSPLRHIIKFYSLLCCLAYWKSPQMMVWAGCRMIRLSLNHGICSDALFGFLMYSGTICMQSKATPIIKEACRVGKAVMSLIERPGLDSNPEIVPGTYFIYYGTVATWSEPLEVCYTHLRKGLEVGMSCGNSENIAFYNSVLLVRCALLGGEHLPSLLKEADVHLKAMHGFGNNLSVPYTSAYRETISTLIDKGEHTASNDFNIDINSENEVYTHRYNETVWLNKMLQNFWLGYATRCHHFASKALDMKPGIGNHNRLVILFYATLNSFRGIKNKNGSGSQFNKMKPLFDEAIELLISAVDITKDKDITPGLFNNKVYLLEAELCSFDKKNQLAKEKYDSSITSSRYIHEKGLACEQAGLHYQKISDRSEALKYFQRASKYYMQWGSQMKVEAMAKIISRLQ